MSAQPPQIRLSLEFHLTLPPTKQIGKLAYRAEGGTLKEECERGVHVGALLSVLEAAGLRLPSHRQWAQQEIQTQAEQEATATGTQIRSAAQLVPLHVSLSLV